VITIETELLQVRISKPEERAGFLGWVAATAVVLLVLVRSPTEYSPLWTAKSAVGLLLIGIALPQLYVLLRHRGPLRRMAVAATAFLGIAALSIVLSKVPALGLFGQYSVSSGVGWLFFLCLVSVWALGATLGEKDIQLVLQSIVITCCLDSAASITELFGAKQSAFSDFLTHIPSFGLSGGQAVGLMDNPVFSGGLLAGGLALLIFTDVYRPRIQRDLIALLATGLELSGSRFGLIVLIVALIWFAFARGLRRVVAVAIPAAVGTAAGYILTSVYNASNLGVRIASAGGSFSPRLSEWTAALQATLHHPLLGFGFAQERSAVSQRWTLSIARSQQYFGDPHNILVTVTLGSGVLGLICFAAWMIPAIRHSKGPLMACALGILAVELIEPLYVGLTPIAFIALGAAVNRQKSSASHTPRSDGSPVSLRSTRTPRSLLLMRVTTISLAVALATVLLIGDGLWRQGTIVSLTKANRVLPPWPDTARALASALHSRSNEHNADSNANYHQAVLWTEVAVRRDPTYFLTLSEFGDLELSHDDLSGARVAFMAALTNYGWYTPALIGMANVELQSSNIKSALGWYQKSLVVSPDDRIVLHQVRCLQDERKAHLENNQIRTDCPVFPGLREYAAIIVGDLNATAGTIMAPKATSTIRNSPSKSNS
jgi:O-Antigen ligase